MKYRQALMQYAQKHGASAASRTYNKGRSFICFWLKRYTGSIENLACRSRRPRHHPREHSHEEIGWIKVLRKRNPSWA